MDGERSDLIIRSLKEKDTPRLVKMDLEISGRGRREWYQRKVRRALEETDVMISLGAEIDGLLVGALMGSVYFGEFGRPEPIAILDTMLVDREFSRQGIATAMLEQLVKNLKGLRIDRLRTEVQWDQLDLLAFFGRVGFEPVPRLVLECDLTKDDTTDR